MRAFVALVPPPAVAEHLHEFLAPRREAGGLRWSDPGHVHITLAFLPELAERDLDDVGERLGQACARRVPVDLHLSGGGAFPDAALAKVLWAGVTGQAAALQELTRVARGCRTAASVAGTRVGGGPFRPHVTLARLGHPADVTRWLRILDTYEGPSWRADDVVLVRSRLGQGRAGHALHEALESYPLSAA